MNTRIHPEDIEALMESAEIHVQTIFDKVTLVAVKFESGFVLTESSGAVDKANYSEDQGKEVCLEKIRSQLWKLEGYALQKTIHRAGPERPQGDEIPPTKEDNISAGHTARRGLERMPPPAR